MAEAWQNNDGQPMNRGCYNQNGGASFASRNFNNSNYNKAPRREGGMNGGGGGGGGGYQGQQRSNYNTGNGFSGGYRYGQNGGGRPFHGDRQPRMNNPPRQFNFDPSAPCSKIDIDSTKVGMVIGRGGGKIREIQDSFNVHVKIDRDPGLNGLTGVTIRGEEDSIEQAKHFIQDLIAVK